VAVSTSNAESRLAAQGAANTLDSRFLPLFGVCASFLFRRSGDTVALLTSTACQAAYSYNESN
jgi:hypothetical protein